jgi:hypothetical protein
MTENGPPWRYLFNETHLAVTVKALIPNDMLTEFVTDFYGFRPSIIFDFKISLSFDFAVSSGEQAVKIVDFLLRKMQGDLAYSSEFERIIMLRRDACLYLREDYERSLRPEDLRRFISVPYETMVFKLRGKGNL